MFRQMYSVDHSLPSGTESQSSAEVCPIKILFIVLHGGQSSQLTTCHFWSVQRFLFESLLWDRQTDRLKQRETERVSQLRRIGIFWYIFILLQREMQILFLVFFAVQFSRVCDNHLSPWNYYPGILFLHKATSWSPLKAPRPSGMTSWPCSQRLRRSSSPTTMLQPITSPFASSTAHKCVPTPSVFSPGVYWVVTDSRWFQAASHLRNFFLASSSC